MYACHLDRPSRSDGRQLSSPWPSIIITHHTASFCSARRLLCSALPTPQSTLPTQRLRHHRNPNAVAEAPPPAGAGTFAVTGSGGATEVVPGGEAVEVLPDEGAYRGAHLPAVIARFDPDLCSYAVEYDALAVSGASGRARSRRPCPRRRSGRAAAGSVLSTRRHAPWMRSETARGGSALPSSAGTGRTGRSRFASRRRGRRRSSTRPMSGPTSSGSPAVALPEDMVRVPAHLAKSFQDDGWCGKITEIHPKLAYTFKLATSGKKAQLHQNKLRLRYDWTDNQWKQVAQNLSGTNFTGGDRVEVSSDEEGFHGAWFEGRLSNPSDTNSLWSAALKGDSETTPLKETIGEEHIRPSPPAIPVTNGFKVLDEIDAYTNDGWWVGVISEVLSDQKYKVYFKAYKEQNEFELEQLRRHCDWVGGRWMQASPALEMWLKGPTGTLLYMSLG
ncbi:hypothetical protein ZWY2020_059299 [Hordeum vulgare]|nr:hypothetical protein ZWY2020_059299 [Hordeum vulgare]